jgi:hypothetical protein
MNFQNHEFASFGAGQRLAATVAFNHLFLFILLGSLCWFSPMLIKKQLIFSNLGLL